MAAIFFSWPSSASLIDAQLVGATSAVAAFYRPDTRAWEMLLGGGFALLPHPGRLGRGAARARSLAAWAGATLLAASVFILPRPAFPGIAAVPVCAGAALVLRYASDQNSLGRMLGSAIPVAIGLISYSLYLWHQPLLAFGRIFNAGPLPAWATAMLVAAALACAYASWRFVERPARNQRLYPFRIIASGTAAAIVLLVATGSAGISSHGFAQRYGSSIEKYFEALGPTNQDGGDRGRAIRMGICHFRVDMSPPLASFLAQWHCVGSGRGSGVLVVGDSHAADKAASLELNGVDVAQMTGAACSPAPSKMTKDCRALFDFVLARQAQETPFHVLVIADRMRRDQLVDKEIDEALAFWGGLHVPIVWLSEMPEFDGLEDRKARALQQTGEAMSGEYPVSTDDAAGSFEYLKGQERGRFTTIDSGRIFCSIAQPGCPPFIKGQGWLALTSGHLTVLGARLFGERLLAEPIFKSKTGL